MTRNQFEAGLSRALTHDTGYTYEVECSRNHAGVLFAGVAAPIIELDNARDVLESNGATFVDRTDCGDGTWLDFYRMPRGL